jgi:hypothetical protein
MRANSDWLSYRRWFADNYLPSAHNLNQWYERERVQTVVECQKMSSGNQSNLSGICPVRTLPPTPPTL